jgi:chromosome segregation ATPase
MTDAGQETPTGTSEGQATLLSENKELKDTVARLRGTQSAQDRALENLRTSEVELKAQLADAQAARQALAAEKEQLTKHYSELNTKLETLAPLEAQVPQLQAQAERMRAAAILAGSNPAIALLVEANALPQAETLEEFQQSLTKIAGGLTGVAGNTAQKILEGGRAEPPPAVEESPEALDHQAMVFFNQGNLAEGIKARDRAMELRQKAARS